MAAKGGSGIKILLIVLAVLFVCGVVVVGGIVYVAHRAMNTAKADLAKAGISTSDLSSVANSEPVDACKYLTAGDVSAAVGVPIIDVKSDNGCHYIAQGSAANFTMQHVGAMGGGKSMPAGMPGMTSGSSDSDSTETTSLVDITINSSGGRMEMNLEKKLIGGFQVNGNANGDVAGIGDEAFAIGNNLLLVRKGDKLVQITYTNCPCSVTQIEPLAKKLVDQL
jgi:hypothetical protein